MKNFGSKKRKRRKVDRIIGKNEGSLLYGDPNRPYKTLRDIKRP